MANAGEGDRAYGAGVVGWSVSRVPPALLVPVGVPPFTLADHQVDTRRDADRGVFLMAQLDVAHAPEEAPLVVMRATNSSREGLLPARSGKTGPGRFADLVIPILERPQHTFDATIKSVKVGGEPVKGFMTWVDGKPVAVIMYKEGPMQGTIATSYVLSPTQLRVLGLEP